MEAHMMLTVVKIVLLFRSKNTRGRLPATDTSGPMTGQKCMALWHFLFLLLSNCFITEKYTKKSHCAYVCSVKKFNVSVIWKFAKGNNSSFSHQLSQVWIYEAVPAVRSRVKYRGSRAVCRLWAEKEPTHPGKLQRTGVLRTAFNLNELDPQFRVFMEPVNCGLWFFPLWSMSVSHCIISYSRSTCLSLSMSEWARWRTGGCFVAGYSSTPDPSSTHWWMSSRSGAGCSRSTFSTTWTRG